MAKLKVGLFVLMAFCAALVAVLLVADAGSAAADRGLQKEFEAIIAAVIGGCLLTGGFGSVIGASLGALIFGVVQIGIGYTSHVSNDHAALLFFCQCAAKPESPLLSSHALDTPTFA